MYVVYTITQIQIHNFALVVSYTYMAESQRRDAMPCNGDLLFYQWYGLCLFSANPKWNNVSGRSIESQVYVEKGLKWWVMQ